MLGDAGAADWFGITPEGELALAEVKLGANAEARREIVAQALDYYVAIQRLSYDTLAEACRRPARTTMVGDADLYRVSGAAEAGYLEEEFISRVEANLRTGSLLLILALDRAPERLARLVAAALAEQPALPFDVSLVEMSLHDLECGSVVIVPALRGAVIATTRAVIRFGGGGALTVAPVAVGTSVAGTPRPIARIESDFHAALDAKHPGTSTRLTAFLSEAALVGVIGEMARSLILRLDGVNVGSLHVSGSFLVYFTEAAREAGGAVFADYMNTMQALSGGKTNETTTPGERFLRCDIARLLDRKPEWLAALRTYRETINSEAATPELGM
jgi:hypothetical protein